MYENNDNNKYNYNYTYNYRNGNNQNSTGNSSSGRSGNISWIIIALMFLLGAWPIGAILLFYKLFVPTKSSAYNQAPSLSKEEEAKRRQELEKRLEKLRAENEAKKKVKSIMDAPKDGKKNYILLTVLGALLIIGSVPSLFVVGAATTYELAEFISIALCGCGLVYSGVSMKSAMARYAQYFAIIGKNDAVEIEALANKTGNSKRRVEKDLIKMIEKGYFGKTAYVNKELGYFFSSSQADEELSNARQAAYEKTADAAKKEAAKQTASIYDQTIEQIKEINLKIPGKEMTEKINKIEEITRQIFAEVKKNPQKRSKIDRFMSYYLPTTMKLLDLYADLDSKSVEGENILKSKASIENAMDSVVDGFSRQLDDLYKNENLDVETDVDVLLQMMERESRKSVSDFNTSPKSDNSLKTQEGVIELGGSAAQTK